MPLTFNLSPLIRGKYRDPDMAGAWTQSGRLEDLASSLDVPREQAEIDKLKSLPDPWARPLLFSQALVADDHIAKADARDQWRGLLALLGLRNYYSTSYTLSIMTTDLGDLSAGNERFRSVLRTLLPTESLSTVTNWMRTGVVTIQPTGEDRFDVGEHNAIGLLVPNCLVAPARGARQLSFPDVPWMVAGLRDPLGCDGISATQWGALYNYLGRIKLRLLEPDIDPDSGAQRIREEIDLFMAGCRDKLKAAGITRPKDVAFADAFDDAPAPFYAPIVDAPVLSDQHEGAISECEIQLLDNNGLTTAPGKLAGVILLDSDIATRTLKRPAQDVRAWKNLSLLSSAQANGFDEIQRGAERDKYLVITPDDLLTKKLVRLISNGRVDAHGPQWENFLLPISPLVLFMVDRGKLATELRLNDRGDRFEVSLTLTLKSADPTARAQTHTIVRSYDKKADVEAEAVPEDIVLWPNLSYDRWPWNFMRFSYNSEYEMAPRFAASMESLAETISLMAKDSPGEEIVLLKGLSSPTDLVFERTNPFFRGDIAETRSKMGRLVNQRFRFTDISGAIGEQHILAMGAQALFFAATSATGGDPLPAGCLLLPEKRASLGQGQMEIAVDFGTTNTVVYAKAGNQRDPERMVFEPRVFRPISSRVAEEDTFAFDCVEFLPSSKVTSPFPTVMHRRIFDLRGEQAMQDGVNSNYHGVADNIFFMPEVADKFGFAVRREQNDQLVFDLKWSPDGNVRRMVKRFLRQIVLMSTVEAFGKGVIPRNIKWFFSYPQAWNHTQVDNFKAAVKQAWEEVMQPVLGKGEKATDYVDFETEGAAALRYFTEGPDKGRTGQRVLMFDIGGGSTEIAVYDFGKTVWRSSFKLAGGDFFTGFLSANREVFEQFRTEEGGSTFQEVIEKFGHGNSAKHFVELYISQQSFDATFSDSYPMFSDQPEGIGLRNVALVTIAGLFYYTGLVLRNLVKQGGFTADELREFTIAFAGRGSSFFKFLGDARNSDSLLGRASRIISDVVQAAEDDLADAPAKDWDLTDPRVNDVFSTFPKHEVAYGMLCGGTAAKRTRAQYTRVPLGEGVELNKDGERISVSPTDSVESLTAGSRLSRLGDEEFDRFLDLLARRVGLRINLDSKNGEARTTINNAVRYSFARALDALDGAEDREEDEETLEIEPPFISKLRGLVHVLAKSVEERKSLIVVRNEEPKW